MYQYISRSKQYMSELMRTFCRSTRMSARCLKDCRVAGTYRVSRERHHRRAALRQGRVGLRLQNIGSLHSFFRGCSWQSHQQDVKTKHSPAPPAWGRPVVVNPGARLPCFQISCTTHATDDAATRSSPTLGYLHPLAYSCSRYLSRPNVNKKTRPPTLLGLHEKTSLPRRTSQLCTHMLTHMQTPPNMLILVAGSTLALSTATCT